MANQRDVRLEPSLEGARTESLELLQQQFAYGRLDAQTFDDRLGLVLQARTQQSLAVLTEDLTPLPAVVDGPGATPARKRRLSGRQRAAVAFGATVALVIGVGAAGAVATGSSTAPADEPPGYFCESTQSEDPGQVCPAVSASRIRLDAFATQIENLSYEIENYAPSNELMSRVQRAVRSAQIARDRAVVEAKIEAIRGKSDTKAVEQLAAELEASVDDVADAVADAAAAYSTEGEAG